MKKNTTLSHWSEDGNLRMIDVSEKTPTHREATATGKILIKEETIARIKSGDTPKGDIFTVAKIAGIQAAKQTPALIPMCHPLHITHCNIRFTVEETSISAMTTVKTRNRTGVEMEALVGTSMALLMIYDMLKPIDKTMVISDIELIEKKEGRVDTGRNNYRAAVLTISTSCAREEKKDVSGPTLQKICRDAGIEVLEAGIVTDRKELIREALLCFCEDRRVDIILTTGGTGPGPLDLTPEVTASICDRIIPGIGELMRAEGGKKTMRAYLSRGIAGIRGNTLIVNLPGSPKGVRESMEAISIILIHTLEMIGGGGHD